MASASRSNRPASPTSFTSKPAKGSGDIDNPFSKLLTLHLKRCKIYTSLSLVIGMGCCLCYDSPGLHPKLNGLIIALGFYCIVNCMHYLSVYWCVTTRRAEVLQRMAATSEAEGH